MLCYSKCSKRRELEEERKIENIHKSRHIATSSWVPAVFKQQLQKEDRIKKCPGSLLGLEYPMASLGPPPRQDLWSFGQSGAGLGQSGAFPRCVSDWQFCQAGIWAPVRVWGSSLPSQGKAGPAPSLPHRHPKISGDRQFLQSLSVT